MNFRDALLPEVGAEAMLKSGAAWGTLDLRFDPLEELIVIVGYSQTTRVKVPFQAKWLDEHYSRSISTAYDSGFWYRAETELHDFGDWAGRRHAAVPIDIFSSKVKGFRQPHREGAIFAITVSRTNGAADWAAWLVAADSALRFPVEIVLDNPDLFQPLGDAWPSAAFNNSLVTVIGLGSIGSAACAGLSGYAVRQLALVDPDRLKQHNFARHQALTTELGRLKVNAVAAALRARDRDIKVETLPLDVADDADVMRPLFARTACVLVCSDGVESRRVANHLACRAGIPVVFACVLDDGGIGEVIRVRPGETACLLCSREQLAQQGQLDPEPGLDHGYGTGLRHLPMTAVGGDLDLIGRFAARVTVSTLLERSGFLGERLPADHAIVGLRPSFDTLEAPFDVTRTLEVSWRPLGQPSPDCPSCGGGR